MYIKIDLWHPIISYNPTYESNKVHKCINKQSQTFYYTVLVVAITIQNVQGKNSRGKVYV